MNIPWVSLILLGVAASFLPLQFGLEIALLGSSDGLKKSSSLIGGITLFRILLLVAVGLIFTGLLEKISTLLADISAAVSTTLHQLHLAVTSGQHVIFDGLLIAAGVLLCFRAYHHWRNRTQTKDGKESHSSFTEGLLATKSHRPYLLKNYLPRLRLIEQINTQCHYRRYRYLLHPLCYNWH